LYFQFFRGVVAKIDGTAAGTMKWTTKELTGEPEASLTYTDLAIEAMATVQALYSLARVSPKGFCNLSLN